MKVSNILTVGVQNYILLGVVALSFTLIFQGYNAFVWSFVLPIVDILCINFLYRTYREVGERRFILAMFCWSIIFRFIAVLLMYNVLISYNGIPFLSYKDDYIYQEASVEIMKRWQISGLGFYNDLKFSSDTYSGFPNFSASLMILFGTSPLVPRFGNAILSSITSFIAYNIVKKFTDREKARFTYIILVALPLALIFSAMQFKDTLLLFFIVVGLYASMNIIIGKHVWQSVVLLVFSYIGCSFGRPAVIVPLMVALVVMVGRASLSHRYLGSVFLKVIALMLIAYLLIYSYRILDEMGFIDISTYFDSRYQGLTEKNIYDSTAGVKNLSVAQYLGAPLYFIASLFLPPPLLFSIEESLNYSAWVILQHYAFLPFLIIAMWNSIIQRKEYPIPFFLVLVYVFLRVGQANSILTSFSPRQSLATLYIMYLLLPMYKPGKKIWEQTAMILVYLTMFSYNIVRLLSHGML